MNKLTFTFIVMLFLSANLQAQTTILNFEDLQTNVVTFMGDSILSYNYTVSPAVVNNPNIETGNTSAKVLSISSSKAPFDQDLTIHLYQNYSIPADVNKISFLVYTDIKHANINFEYGTIVNGAEVKQSSGWCTDSIATGRWDTVAIDLLPTSTQVGYIRLYFGNMAQGTQITGDLYLDDFTFAKEVLNLVAPQKIVRFKKGTPSIDGKETDAIWQSLGWNKIGIATNIEKTITTTPMDTNTFGAKFKACYDENFFYIIVNVKDPEVTSYLEIGTDPWYSDGIEIYFEPRNQYIKDKRNQESQHQIRFNYGGNFVITGWNPVLIDTVYTPYAVFVDTYPLATGYNIEAAIAWQSIYFWKDVVDLNAAAIEAASVVSGEFMMGFGIAALQGNADGKRGGVLEWTAQVNENNETIGCYFASGSYGALITEGFASINENENNADFLVYPNPVVSQLDLGTQFSAVTVFDAVGRQVLSVQPTSQFISVANLNAGVYFIKAATSDNQTVSSKFIKY